MPLSRSEMILFYLIICIPTLLMYCVEGNAELVLNSRNSYFFVSEIEIYALIVKSNTDLVDTTVAKLTLHNLMLLTILILSVPTSERES